MTQDKNAADRDALPTAQGQDDEPNPYDEAPEPWDPRSYGVHTPRYLAKDCIGVPKTAGSKMYTTDCPVHRPMPGIVILVHGVNDVGEAYQNQERGIIEGLKKRLGRDDLWPHQWKEKEFRIRNAAGEMETCADPHKKQQVCDGIARSPVIPFYWGYRPVDAKAWKADQREYHEAMLRSGRSPATPRPYDAYRENDPAVLRRFGGEGDLDCFHNSLDPRGVWGGGTFANATTNIPDMLGPGAGGKALAAVGFFSRSELANGGDFTHPVYDNPHRIYQFYAAQRLAALILEIRNRQATRNDTINIVAHSQGTIITLLANMLVKQADRDPADCVILNHSPYSLENRWLEDGQPGHHQTDAARQQTFKNFCSLMATNARWRPDGDGLMSAEDQQAMLDTMGLPRKAYKSNWYDNPLHQRNNFGKVYNYFCPNDGTVSLLPIQGFGWRGIPQDIAKDIPNLRQRVFCQDGSVGLPPDGNPFRKPAALKGDFEYSSVTNASYSFHDVIPTGETLPEPFIFTLMGQLNPLDETADPDKAYKAPVSGNDALVSYHARAGETARTKEVTVDSPPYTPFREMQPGHVMTGSELRVLSAWQMHEVISARVTGTSMADKQIVMRRTLTEAELHKLFSKSDDVMFSQHSSIVMSEKVPELAMAYDLAVGPCRSFDVEHGEFWARLMRLADWREAGTMEVLHYYHEGVLPKEDTKPFMNKPDKVLPTGEHGVVNEFRPQKTKPSRFGYTPFPAKSENAPELQWPMPPVQDYNKVAD